MIQNTAKHYALKIADTNTLNPEKLSSMLILILTHIVAKDPFTRG